MIFNLSHLGLIAVTGTDADKFLQGQCTNDLRQLTPNTAQLGSHCNPKGRMLAIFKLLRHGDVIYLQMPISILPSLLERLNKYRLRAKVELNDVSEQIQSFGIAGENTISLLNTALFNDNAETIAKIIPEQLNAVYEYSPFMLMRMPGQVLRIQIVGPQPQLQVLKNQLIELGAAMNEVDKWKLLEIQSGIPTLYPETMDAFIPQMTNLQLLGGVSFNKGCYVGQEVIARLQHLGAVKRRLFRAEVATSRCPQPGETLFAETSDSAQGAGKILDASLRKDNVFELLAVVEIESAQQDIVRIGDNNGPSLQFLAPY